MFGYYYGATSFAFFFLFDRKLSSLISKNLPKYRLLDRTKQQDWDTRNASTVHAIIVSALCLYVVFWENIVIHNLVKGYSEIAEANMAVAIGYLCSDLIFLLLDYKRYGNNLGYMIHHSVSICAYYLALSQGLLSYFGNFRLLAEISTPFVNFRWALATTGNKGGTLYFYNGCIMTFLFFLSRIFVMPYFYFMVWKVTMTEIYHQSVTQTVHVTWIGVCVILDILNIFWFHKMMSGVLKHLIKSSAPGKGELKEK